MSTDHRKRHAPHELPPPPHNGTYTDRLTENDTFDRIDIEPEQGCCSKLLILSAIVLFISFTFSSVPHILSAQQPPPPPSHAHKDSVNPSSSPSPVPIQQHFAHVVNSNNQQHDTSDAVGGVVVENSPWAHMTVSGQANARAPQDIPTHPTFTQGSPPPSTYLPPASASSFSSYHPPSSQDHQRQHPPKDAKSKHDSTIWPIVQASAWFAYRASLWSMRTSYWAARSVVAKPYLVMAALFETPYTMMRDICLAFLPVYSFFTIAAVIGILVGGSAMWIAQLLISAIGADRETPSTTSTAVGYSQSKPVAYHASQQHIRTFKQGQQQQQQHVPLSRTSSTEGPISPATVRRDTTRGRATNLPSRTPPATMQTTLAERGSRRRREPLTDDDDDDDDDDYDNDDDNDWRRV